MLPAKHKRLNYLRLLRTKNIAKNSRHCKEILMLKNPDCTYIKIWVPELAGFSAKEIHAMEASEGKYLRKIVNLRETAEETKLMFKQAAQN